MYGTVNVREIIYSPWMTSVGAVVHNTGAYKNRGAYKNGALLEWGRLLE